MTTPKTRVLLADDNEGIRQGIRRMLNKAEDIEVVGEARNGEETIVAVSQLLPDVLLLDVEMPRLNGIEVARQLKKAGKKVRILVLSAYDDPEYIQSMLANGVSGYLIKEEAPERIIDAVRGVALGETGWINPQKKGRPKGDR